MRPLLKNKGNQSMVINSKITQMSIYDKDLQQEDNTWKQLSYPG